MMTLTFKQVLRLLRAIRTMERACMASEHEPTTAREVYLSDLKELRGYFKWLRDQCPVTGMFYDFDKLVGV